MATWILEMTFKPPTPNYSEQIGKINYTEYITLKQQKLEFLPQSSIPI